MKKRILIVDDEPDVVKTTKLLLECEGYEVFSAGSAETGLANLHEVQPNLLLLDLRLPDMSGFQMVTKMRSIEEYKNIPVIVLSGMDDMVSRHIATMQETLEFVEKPIDIEKLKSYISDLLGE
jgi:DNA-binding response OmpR family regulator